MRNDENQNFTAIEKADEDFMGVLKRMQADLGSYENPDEESSTMTMSPDECHNKAVRLSRLGDKKEAIKTSLAGLKVYPQNIDLMADTIKYASEQGDFETAGHWFEQLSTNVSRRFWNWRAFTFSTDYLLMDAVNNEAICRELVQDYVKYLPFEEKAYMAQSEFEEAIGNHEASLKVLKDAISILPNAAQCALRLADKQLECGMYSDVVETARYGLAASAETQPSINAPYLHYVMNLAEDALLHRRFVANHEVPSEDVQRIRRKYIKMSIKFDELDPYSDTIHLRVKMLDMLLEGDEETYNIPVM
jgi:tetratricopeptide (TPR) repeat protein